MALAQVAERLAKLNDLNGPMLALLWREILVQSKGADFRVEDLSLEDIKNMFNKYSDNSGPLASEIQNLNGAEFHSLAKIVRDRLQDETNYDTTVEAVTDAQITLALSLVAEKVG